MSLVVSCLRNSIKAKFVPHNVYTNPNITTIRLLLVHEEIDQMPSECKNSPKPEDRQSIAETGRTYSDSITMPARPGNRPGLLKLEKRSSMSQLLSQLKDRLPGRKSKGM